MKNWKQILTNRIGNNLEILKTMIIHDLHSRTSQDR